ncbi:putative quinol monooxygenase [Burkholderia sp. Ac-20353]|uniref:putative quinol monooxygenase n=1 Tax=Burkholderia sp. Ac-20353 TaxID=2703894 RepID=UPI00197B5934|nr:putative quinol monooxygenase [Burkholderia sp. Ac-20353]MBN3787894.1 antibiotic biosynthesis monooxygenase [Burkholderia sp. Ac-20353]
MPFYVYATLVPKSEHVQTVEAALRDLVAATRAEPGNQRYDLFHESDGSPGFHLFEVYDDQAAFDAHRASLHFAAFREKAAEWLAQPPVIKILTAVDAVDA